MPSNLKVTVINHPLAVRDLTLLRDKATPSSEFRAALKRIASVVVSKVSEKFKLKAKMVETPLEKTKGYELADKIVLVPVLRAGLGLLDSFLDLMPDAKVGHIGLSRNEKSLKPVDYYMKVPGSIRDARVLLLDPMLATGGSASAAINFLKQSGANNITLVSLVASPEGVSKVNKDHPNVKVYTVALDRELNNKGYILPGLGDAGDRTFGTEK